MEVHALFPCPLRRGGMSEKGGKHIFLVDRSSGMTGVLAD